jgi:hypothetical protein
MTDLTNKFSTIEGQLAAQHTEIMAGLNTIAYALGAPPTTPTTTLEDLSLQLTAIIDGLAVLYAGNNAYQASALSLLSQINQNTDTIINNNALNAQRLLIAIAANDPCKSCDVLPIAPPPIQVTPQPIDQDHCKRMQALIYALRRFTVKLDILSSFGTGFSPTVIHDAIAEIITELGVAELLEFPSLGEVAQIASAGAAYVFSNLFTTNSLPAAFLSIEDQLLVVLYDTDNASAGQAAYRSFLDGSGLPSAIVQLFKAMAYTSVFNLYYDTTKMLDLSGYDGTICTPESPCAEVTSNNIISNEAGTFYVIDPVDPYPGNAPTFNSGNYIGYTITLISANRTKAVAVGSYNPGGSYVGVGSLVNQFDTCTVLYATAAIGYYSETLAGDGHYTLQICAPDEL